MPRETNDVSDIEGAAPALRWTRWEKPDLFTTSDIEGAQPKKLHAKMINRPESLSTAGVSDAKPRTKVFRTQRVVDPLNPEYKLPQAKLAPLEEPKFLRDTLDVSDLPGARPKTHKARQNVRDQLDISDIPGATQETSFLFEKSQKQREILRYSLDVQDIVSKRKRTNRVSDPLRPVYFVNNLKIQDSPRTRPHTSANDLRPTPGRGLRTTDIPGAQAGSLLRAQMDCPVRTKAPVEGSGADSLCRGLITKRPPTNPLQPTYRGLDGEMIRCSTAPASRRRAPAPFPPNDTVIQNAGDKGFSHTPVLSDEQSQQGILNSIFSDSTQTRPYTSGSARISSSRYSHAEEKQDQSSAKHPLHLMAKQSTKMIPVDMSDAAMTISLQRKVVIKDSRLEDSAGCHGVQEVGVQAAQVRVRSPTPRVSGAHAMIRSSSNGSTNTSSSALRAKPFGSVQQDRIAVANLPDTLSASSCLFPNRNHTRKRHK